MVNDRLLQQFIFWGVWLVIPLIWEIATGILSAVIVALNSLKNRDFKIEFFPRVTVLIPVYNSEKTLRKCLESIVSQHYPIEKIEVLLIDNGSSDNSYSVYTRFQEANPQMRVWWHRSEQGKSKALNKGIFTSTGKYIINIDSDGHLDKNAIKNVVGKFEDDERVTCMTGVVLIDQELIEETLGKLLKTTRICELFEYVESFLIGRSFQSVFNSMYTMAGAFSCFRREVLMRTQMYNSETLGEDAHMSFQVKDFIGGRVVICDNAFLFVEPIESLDKLYIQRQRWQRAELEVANLFTGFHLGGIWSFIKKPSMRKLISDHTLTFPRLIWFFAMIYLYFINYPLKLLIGANLLLYAAYVLNSFVYLVVSLMYLKEHKKVRRYMLSHWYICLILPMYRFIVYWMRVAGIINSVTMPPKWRTKTFSEEIDIIKTSLNSETKTRLPFIETLKKIINSG